MARREKSASLSIVSSAEIKVTKPKQKDEIVMPVDAKTRKLVAETIAAYDAKKEAETKLNALTDEIRVISNNWMDSQSLEKKQNIGSFFIEGAEELEERIQVVPYDKFSNISADGKSTDPKTEIDEKLDELDKLLKDEYSNVIETKTTVSLKPNFVQLMLANSEIQMFIKKQLNNNPKFKTLVESFGYHDKDEDGNVSLFESLTQNIVKKGTLNVIYKFGKEGLEKILNLIKRQEPAIKFVAKK